MGILIDTSTFVELERRGRPVEELLEQLGPDTFLAMSSITASELLVGVLRGTLQARRARREVAVNAILDRVPVLPFDLAAAQVHARLWAEMAAAGRIIGAHDFLIAATALSNGHDVLTQNVREFSRSPACGYYAHPGWATLRVGCILTLPSAFADLW